MHSRADSSLSLSPALGPPCRVSDKVLPSYRLSPSLPEDMKSGLYFRKAPAPGPPPPLSPRLETSIPAFKNVDPLKPLKVIFPFLTPPFLGSPLHPNSCAVCKDIFRCLSFSNLGSTFNKAFRSTPPVAPRRSPPRAPDQLMCRQSRSRREPKKTSQSSPYVIRWHFPRLSFYTAA